MNYSPESPLRSSIWSLKTIKNENSVTFSNDIKYYFTEWQEPIINEGDDNFQYLDIESMISGDEDSSSHVSFNTLDKSTAGKTCTTDIQKSTAMDTETFEELPRRLSLSESDGPGGFSMDLVIEKLLAHCQQPEVVSIILPYSSSEAYVEPINLSGIYSYDEDKNVGECDQDIVVEEVKSLFSSEKNNRSPALSIHDLMIRDKETIKMPRECVAEKKPILEGINGITALSISDPTMKNDASLEKVLSSSITGPFESIEISSSNIDSRTVSQSSAFVKRQPIVPFTNSWSSSVQPSDHRRPDAGGNVQNIHFVNIDLPYIDFRPKTKEGPVGTKMDPKVTKIKPQKIELLDKQEKNDMVPSRLANEMATPSRRGVNLQLLDTPKSKDFCQLSIEKVLNSDKCGRLEKKMSPRVPKKGGINIFRRKNSCATIATELSNRLSSQISTSIKSQPRNVLSAAQFRRHERSNRHESVAIDLGRGVEKYCTSKLIKNILLLWLVFPVALCVLAYGIIPYDYKGTLISADQSRKMLSGIKNSSGNVWGVALIPMILVTSNMGALAVEIYSKVITEIEFGVLIIEDTPSDYLYVAFAAVIIGMGFQAFMFGTFGAGIDGNWLVVISSVFITIAIMLRKKFIKSKKSLRVGIEERNDIAFRQMILGLFLLFYVTSVGYTIFAIIYTAFNDLSSGIFLAILFPFLRFFIIFIAEQCPCVRWGHSRGNFCAGYIVTVIAAAWHGVFLCLIVGCASQWRQLTTLAIVEGSLQIGVLALIAIMPNDTDENDIDNGDDESKTIKQDIKNKTNRHSLILRNVVACADVQSSSNVLEISKSTNLAKGKNRSLHSMDDSLRENVYRLEDIEDGKSEGQDEYVEFDSQIPQREEENKMEMGIIEEENLHIPRNLSTNRTNSVSALFSISLKEKSRIAPRTVEHDSREVRLAVFLSFTWITGVLTPIAFLLCSLIFSIGPNRELFSINVGNTNGTHSESSAGFNQIWSVSFFSNVDNERNNDLWYTFSTANVTNNLDISTFLVKTLLGITIFHMVMLLAGFKWLKYNGQIKNKMYRSLLSTSISCQCGSSDSSMDSNGVSKDIFGLISALLEYNYNLVAFTLIMTLAVVFSIIFPWSGMNTSFEL